MNGPAMAKAPQLLALFHERWTSPDRIGTTALIDTASTLSYGELHEAVGQCAGWLRERGVGPGDRIAVAMQRSSRQVVLLLGAMAAGACPCPLEPGLGEEEMRRRIALADLRWIATDDANSPEIGNAGLPAGRTLVYPGPATAASGWRDDLAPDSDGLLLFTSGSSGKPKGVLLSHRGLLVNAQGIAARTGLSPADRLLHIMPLHHTNGINNQLLAPFLAGSCVVLADRFKADHMPELLEKHRPTIVTGVPTMFSRMLALDYAPQALHSLRMLRCGSAPITEELHQRIEEKFGLPLVVSYGLSEATCTSTMNPPGARRIGSVGQPLDGQTVVLRTAQGGWVREPGAEGEICIQGPSLMTGYLLEGAQGVPEPLGGVLRTGDLGRFDADGYLTITGRLKDVIIRGGENLSPLLIEEAIDTVAGVAGSCVVGKPHADLGEVPLAFVVREPGPEGAGLQASAILDAVRLRLSRIHEPAEVRFVDALSENSTGKVDRKAMKALAGG